MSGIYGFLTCRDEKNNMLRQRVLQGWHRQYGNKTECKMASPGAGLGANLEHFSDQIDISSPIIELKGNRFAAL